MYKHLIFFDGECPFCHQAVRRIIQMDEHKRFAFAPVLGETADQILIGPQTNLRNANSLILLENYQSTERKFSIEARAIFRIYWILGGWHKLIGIFAFFPTCLGDWVYRYIAAHRHEYKLNVPENPVPDERFLP